MATKTLAVVITGDSSGAQRAFDSTGSSADQLQSKLDAAGARATSTGRAMTFGLTLPLVAFGKASFDAASDLNESMSKSEQIFGRNASAIEQWAAGAARGFGQSKQQALENAASFGNMFNQIGIGIPKATQMSKKMVELASDFASFHNADISDVLIAQQAAFRGEYDALQRFVPTINAAAVEQQAMAMSGKENTAQLTAQDKALATYRLMLDNAGKATGDFDRTNDGAANKMRIMQAEIQNSTAAIGQHLLPIVQKGAGWVADLAGEFADLPGPVQDSALVFATLVAVAGPATYIFGAISKGISTAISVWQTGASTLETLGLKAMYAYEALKTMSLSPTMAITGLLGLGAAAYFVFDALSTGGDEMEKMETIAKRWASGTMLSAKSTGNEYGALKTKVQELRGVQGDLLTQYPMLKNETRLLEATTGRHGDTLERAADLYILNRDKIGELTPRVAELKQQMEEAKAAEEARSRAVSDLADGTTTLASTTQLGRDAINDFNNVLLAAAGGPIAYQAALQNQAKAQEDLNTAIQEHGPYSDEASAAALRLEQAQLQVASANEQNDAKMADLVAGIRDGTIAYDDQIKRLQLQLYLHPEAAAGYQLEIDKLNAAKAAADALPAAKSVEVNATGDAWERLGSLGSTIGDLVSAPFKVKLNVES